MNTYRKSLARRAAWSAFVLLAVGLLATTVRAGTWEDRIDTLLKRLETRVQEIDDKVAKEGSFLDRAHELERRVHWAERMVFGKSAKPLSERPDRPVPLLELTNRAVALEGRIQHLEDGRPPKERDLTRGMSTDEKRQYRRLHRLSEIETRYIGRENRTIVLVNLNLTDGMEPIWEEAGAEQPALPRMLVAVSVPGDKRGFERVQSSNPYIVFHVRRVGATARWQDTPIHATLLATSPNDTNAHARAWSSLVRYDVREVDSDDLEESVEVAFHILTVREWLAGRHLTVQVGGHSYTLTKGHRESSKGLLAVLD